MAQPKAVTVRVKRPSVPKSLTRRINAEHRRCIDAMSRGLQHAIRCGELLAEAKERVGHGNWIPWLDEHFEGTSRLARQYMQVAREYPKLEVSVGRKRKRVSDLSFREALKTVQTTSAHLNRAEPADREAAIELMDREGASAAAAVYEAQADRRRRERVADAAAYADNGQPADQDHDIHHADFRELPVPDEHVDLIVADPPYEPGSADLWSAMAEQAARVLKPGGSLIAYAGVLNTLKMGRRIEDHLRYWATCFVQHAGSGRSWLRHYGLIVSAKPILWFVRGHRRDPQTLVDCMVPGGGQEKDDHPWQQAVGEAAYFIERLSEPGDLVYDPFVGVGTTAVAAAGLGRRCVGCDTDEGNVAIARQRVAECRAAAGDEEEDAA